MASNMKESPDPIDVQDLQFKKCHFSQIFEAFSLPLNANNLIVSDGRKGLLYIAHNKKLTVLKPAVDNVPESRLDIELPNIVTYLAINCDYSYLAIAYQQPAILIYDTTGLSKKNLNLISVCQIAVSADAVQLLNLKWNPTNSNMLCTIASDYSIGIMQIKTDLQIPPTKLPGIEPLCVAWSPKGKQLAIGCKNGNIIQLKPDLKIARTITGPVPPIGEIIALLWISNYQFCAAYFDKATQTITAVIVDAPKGATQISFTCYDSLLNRIPEQAITPRFYFEYIAEYGIIIAAINDCSEAAVIGTSDDGVTWVIWQMESNARAELPMIKCNDSYPVGLAIDRSTTNKIYLDAENMAKYPFPILHLLGTSGHLVSFYIINLKPNSPNICKPPTETVILNHSIKPVEGSTFHTTDFSTSTPINKHTESQVVGKSIPNIINSPVVGTKGLGFSAENQTLFANRLNLGGETPIMELSKPTGLFAVNEQKVEEIKNPSTKIDTPKPIKFPLQKESTKIIDIPAKTLESIIENKSEQKEQAKPTKSVVKTSPPERKYDDIIYLRAYQEEWKNFEDELKTKLEYLVWDIGTEEEKQMLVKKTAENEEGLTDIKNSLNDDLACIKSLLLQSFAWVGEAKVRRSSNFGRKFSNENLKLTKQRNTIYYLQSQIHKINNTLCLKLLDENKEDQIRIPNIEFIYMTLIRQEQVISKQKEIVDNISKKIKSSGNTFNVSTLNQSMSGLNISKTSSCNYGDEYGIEMRCKTIATRQKNLSRNKKMQLKDFFMEKTPQIIKPVNPTCVQDRLNATLSFLASSKSNNPTVETQSRLSQGSIQLKGSQRQAPLNSLNNLISRLGKETSPIQNLPQVNPTITINQKVSSFSPVITQTIPKSKEIITTTNIAEPIKEGFMKHPIASADQSKTGFSIQSIVPQVNSSETTPMSKSTSPVNSLTSQKPAFGFSPQQKSTNLFCSKIPGSSFNFSPSTAMPILAQTTQTTPQKSLNLGSLTIGLQQPEFSVTSSQNTTDTPIAPMPSPLVFKTPQTSLFTKNVPSTTSSPSSIASGMVISPAFCRSVTTTIATPTILDKMTSSISSNISSAPSTGGIITPQSTFSFSNMQSSVTITPLPTSVIVTSTTTPTKTNVTPNTTASTLLSFSFLNNTASTTSLTNTSTATTTTSTFTNSIFGGMLSTTSASTYDITKPTDTTSIFGGTSTTTAPIIKNVFGKRLDESGMNFASVTITPINNPSTFGGSSTTSVPTTATTGTKSLFGGETPIFTTTTQHATSGTSTTPLFSSSTTSITPFKTTPTGYAGIFGGTTSIPAFDTSTATTTVLSASTFDSLTNTSSASTTSVGTPTTSASKFSTPTTSTTAFGTPTTSTTSFGTPTTSATIFSTSNTSASNMSFGTQTTSAAIFGTSTTNASSFGAPTTGTTAFSTPTNNSATMFGIPITNTTIFGTSTSASTFGTPTTSTSTFGTSTTTTSTFGTQNTSVTTFGTPTTNVSTFGTPATTVSTFGTPTTSSTTFGTATTNAPFGTIFGSVSTNTGSVFGSSANNPGTFTSIFKAANAGGNDSMFKVKPSTGTTNTMFGGTTTSAAFGVTGQTSVFKDANKTQGSLFGSSGTGIFGSANQPTSPLGSNMMAGTAPVFGQSATFGAKSVFGSPTGEFGSKPVFGNNFGAFGTGTTNPGFGSPPNMGTNVPQMGTTGTMGKVFGGATGSNTFESLANQSGGLSFGSLAQKTTEPQQQAPSFSGGSSFSSWR